ncbi:MAG: hypothetical protein ONB37_17185 [candidate division KSB1 bacterium]|nr:hypothetical protein [candidate division KSB1 bacterium]
MKHRMNLRLVTFLIYIFLSVFIFTESKSQALNGFHVRRGVWGDPPNEYQFKDVPANAGLLAKFPLEEIYREVGPEYLNTVELDYWIFTSISDAEMAMVERLDMSSLLLRNMIDYPLNNGFIGDNCWHSIELTGSIIFIRNNVLTFISPRDKSQFDSKTIEQISRKIDSVIIKSDKVASLAEIPAPIIKNVNIISDLPQDMQDVVKIKIDASDVNGKKLYFRKYATGLALVSETGVLTISFNKNTDLTEDPNKVKVKIWVWNEDRLVSSTEKEIPFYKASTGKYEGHSAEVKQAFTLMQNWPNPFNFSTAIGYVLLRPMNVRLRVFDIYGREVNTLVNDYQNVGYYQAIFNGKDSKDQILASGIYFYILQAESFQESRAMILLR